MFLPRQHFGVGLCQRPLDRGRVGEACQWPDAKFPTELSIPAHLKALPQAEVQQQCGFEPEAGMPTYVHACIRLHRVPTHECIHADTYNMWV